MTKFKLSIMMFLQYMMYAVRWVPLAAYLPEIENYQGKGSYQLDEPLEIDAKGVKFIVISKK
jgi:hypothetical protein